MGKIILVGIGNEFRRDDGVGTFISREIETKKLEGITVIQYRGEGLGLMDIWKDFNIVILFDAVSSGSPAGTIYRVDLSKEKIPRSMKCCSTHALNITEVIALAKTLGQLPKQIIVYGVEGKSFENGTGLSPEVKKSAKQVVQQATEEIVLFQR